MSRVPADFVEEVPLTRWMAEGQETEDGEGAVKAAQASHHKVRDGWDLTSWVPIMLYHPSICVYVYSVVGTSC